jgi:hypothetical protein
MNDTENITDFLLAFARKAATLQAARDDGNPESQVTALLSALRHWCHRYDIDWEGELRDADERVTQDLVGPEGDASYVSCPDIKELQCPKCGHDGSFLIEVSANVLMFADGVELHGDEGEQWNKTSSCVCPTCSHLGMAFQFHNEKRKER